MKSLFKEFKPASFADWKAQLMKDLKGEAYEGLIWHNENGFDIEPFYTSEHLQHDYEPAFTHAAWEVCVTTDAADPAQGNAYLLKELNRGASSIFIASPCADYKRLLQDISLQHIQSAFVLSSGELDQFKAAIGHASGSMRMSLFANDLKSQPELSRWLRSSASISGEQIKTVTADVYGFHNQNCLAYYEVALAMCNLLEYVHCFGGEKIELPASAFVIRTGVSSDYFIQMAKLRAMRRLWRVLAKDLGAGNELHIIAGTSLCNKSVSDSYNNLLRSSIEAMAAVAGGCDELMVNPLDVFLPGKTELADRMAINQQLILKDEVYMDKMADISCGSYFIETITDHIAEKALEAVKQIEKAGGFFKALENGDIRAEIARQSKERASLVNSGEQVAVGVNKFRNEKEQTKFDPKILETLKDQKIENPFITYEMEKLNTTKHA